ncbi:hypothetical protein ACFE04_015049 [Oxalis oulophora]
MVYDSRNQSDVRGGNDNTKNTPNPVFNVPGLFIGPNGLSYNEHVKSLASDSDARALVNIDNHAIPNPDKKFGLSIVDNLNNDFTNGSGKVLRGFEGRKVVLGPPPQMGIKPPKCDLRKSLFHNGSSSSNVIFEIGKHASLPNLNSPVAIPTSLPIKSCLESLESLSARDVELSEEYTRVISGGQITHIYGDKILECPSNSLTNFDMNKKKEFEALQAGTSSAAALNRPEDFLSICYSCNNKLPAGEDIYIYRGERSFCSKECRLQLISMDAELEKYVKEASANTRQTRR